MPEKLAPVPPLIKEYLGELEQWHDQLPVFPGSPEGEQRFSRVYAGASLFVETNFADEPDFTPRRAASDEAKIEREMYGRFRRGPEDLDGNELLQRYSRSLVLGGPGAGKTSFFRMQVCSLAANYEDSGVLPVPLSGSFGGKFLAQFHENQDAGQSNQTESPEKLINEYILHLLKKFCKNGRLKELEKIIHRHLDHGKAVILVDSLQPEFLPGLRSLLTRYEKCRFLVTSRTARMGDPRFGFTIAHLQPLRPTQSASLLKKWADLRKQKEIEYKNLSASARKLIANPFFCTMLALLDAPLDMDRQSPTQLIQALVKSLLQSIPDSSDLINQGLSLVAFNECLAAIATTSFEFPGLLNSSRAEEQIQTALKTNPAGGKANRDSERLLNLFLSSKLLVADPRRTDGVSFLHPLLEEYFLARAIIYPQDQLEKRVLEHLFDPRWREVFYFAVAIQNEVSSGQAADLWNIFDRIKPERYGLPHEAKMQYHFRLSFHCLMARPAMTETRRERMKLLVELFYSHPHLSESLAPLVTRAFAEYPEESKGVETKIIADLESANHGKPVDEALICCLAALQRDGARQWLVARLQQTPDDVHFRILDSLDWHNVSDAFNILLRYINMCDPAQSILRDRAVQAAREIVREKTTQQEAEELWRLIKDTKKRPEVRGAAAQILMRCQPERIESELNQTLEQENRTETNIRWFQVVARIIGLYGSQRAVKALQSVVDEIESRSWPEAKSYPATKMIVLRSLAQIGVLRPKDLREIKDVLMGYNSEPLVWFALSTAGFIKQISFAKLVGRRLGHGILFKDHELTLCAMASLANMRLPLTEPIRSAIEKATKFIRSDPKLRVEAARLHLKSGEGDPLEALEHQLNEANHIPSPDLDQAIIALIPEMLNPGQAVPKKTIEWVVSRLRSSDFTTATRAASLLEFLDANNARTNSIQSPS